MVNNQSIVILGASADMAKPFIEKLAVAKQFGTYYLLARDVTKLNDIKNTLVLSGAEVNVLPVDLSQPFEPFYFKEVHCFVSFAGWLPENNNQIDKSMLVNYEAIKQFTLDLITNNSDTLEHVMLIGSIAGVRVRQRNWNYGAAKAALHKFALELQRTYTGFKTTLVIPGYVQTKMLDGLKTPAALTISTEAMADKLIGYLKTKPGLVYSQTAWRVIGMILLLIPEFIFKRLKF
ncbi:SDR family NAD(P)-dependent oxidoreductase [Polluticaenibacter yanchengensis]|uniref:SDR family NAD(P)-dependent oxidoreductase n=1 Tax=Polluticaenibacter yanchengensis TaxID=3014562 RepID=A0ABT4UME1_9BACT|nr:SDR family NAD(P)-dependent oxidoreductase [Chitinophagaceae bacterium LY-5]